jgi:hypothetical protein
MLTASAAFQLFIRAPTGQNWQLSLANVTTPFRYDDEQHRQAEYNHSNVPTYKMIGLLRMVTNSGFSLSGSAELPGAVLRHFIAEVILGKGRCQTKRPA